MDFFQLQGAHAAIQKNFHRYYDPSRVSQAVRDSHKLRELGRGRHFSSRLFRTEDFDYVLSLAHRKFVTGAELQRWFQAMERLRQCDHPLIPPLEWGQLDDLCYYVSPYCGEPFAGSRQDLDMLLEDLAKKLWDHGLYYDDYWQIRCLSGHPMVIDWSDLQLTAMAIR
ncbi:hypothetical protein [Pseudobacteriovorax antillogorgiicola]|uniref:Uncharacterized protein n=1 Tax=Pseudobacteriovorax antillogorgiicola TaxID=1513793 RepID=A0A1Y6C0X5_9BACT|nr:hypothetical protein [Pseudobacteriovorax antillogorgiicola]TCS51168.1 hypothetical protein EDD56_11151 [Pseudobacteriovorax antillogorgiicola]SMF38066.1 hypothetical protein SAMN06296036_111127 [Pseudobacteriovorax antillogorgiicola]